MRRAWRRSPTSMTVSPRPDPDLAPPGGVHGGQPLVQDHPAGGEVRPTQHGQQVLDRHLRVGHLQPHRPVHLAQVVRRHVGGHPHGDPARAVHQQVRQPSRQADRFGGLAVVAGAEVHGVLVQLVEHLHGCSRQPALGVPGRRRRVVERAEVALGIHQRDGAAEVLPHAHQRVVDGGIAVRVIVPHRVAHDAGALAMRRVGPQPHAQHRVQDAALHRLESVAHVGDCPGGDHRQGVRQERLRHLVGDRGVQDLAGERQAGGRSGTSSWAHRSILTAGLSPSRAGVGSGSFASSLPGGRRVAARRLAGAGAPTPGFGATRDRSASVVARQSGTARDRAAAVTHFSTDGPARR